MKKSKGVIVALLVSFFLSACSTSGNEMQVDITKRTIESETIKNEETSTSEFIDTRATHTSRQAIDKNESETALAFMDYKGTQTIDVNNGNPEFSKADLSLEKGAWEEYGDLDQLNRATYAEAMLNQSIMPTEKRSSLSSVTPTGWKNKKIKGGYLFNRSHLIGFALAGENANWKNLITGTRQLNSPEMLRHEMDVKYYLEQSSDNYVRYSVIPIFRDDELLARGVQMQAQSINSDEIAFNVYIFNVQDGVELNYSDGSSQISDDEGLVEEKKSSNTSQVEPSEKTTEQPVYVTPTGKKYHVRAHGNGSFNPTTLENAKEKGLDPCGVCY